MGIHYNCKISHLVAAFLEFGICTRSISRDIFCMLQTKQLYDVYMNIYITIYIYYTYIYIFTDTNNLTPKLFYHILGKYSPGWKESPCHQGQKISRIWKSCKEPRLRNQWPTLGPHGGFLGHVSWDVWAEPFWLCLRVFLLRMIWINIISCTDEYHLCILFWQAWWESYQYWWLQDECSNFWHIVYLVFLYNW